MNAALALAADPHWLAHAAQLGHGGVGVFADADDQRRGAVIEALLCHGKASLDADLAAEAAARLAPFASRGLARLADGVLTIEPDGRPYARTIAALFDPYRQDSLRRFSSAV